MEGGIWAPDKIRAPLCVKRRGKKGSPGGLFGGERENPPGGGASKKKKKNTPEWSKKK